MSYTYPPATRPAPPMPSTRRKVQDQGETPEQFRERFENHISQRNAETWDNWMRDRLAAGQPPITNWPDAYHPSPQMHTFISLPVAPAHVPFLTQVLRWCGLGIVLCGIAAAVYGSTLRQETPYVEHSTRVPFLR